MVCKGGYGYTRYKVWYVREGGRGTQGIRYDM